MLSKEEIKKWLLENCTNELGDLDLSCLDFSDFDGNVNISEMKVKKSLNQSWQKVGGDLRQNYQEVDGRIFYDFGSLNYDFKKMSPAEKGEFIINVFGGDDGDIRIESVDLSGFDGNVHIGKWNVKCNLFQDDQIVGGNLYQDGQRAGENIYQNGQSAVEYIYQSEQCAGVKVVKDQENKCVDKCPNMCVEPDYKAEYERLSKELCEANRKIETLMWALEKAKEANK